MDNNRDKYAGFDNETICDLNWEVISARGVDTGDVMALYKVTFVNMALMEQIEAAKQTIVMSILSSGQPMFAMEVAEQYDLLIAFIVRESQEILKFLYKRNFHFPDIKFDDNGEEL